MKICFVGSSNTLFTHAYLEVFSKISSDLSFIDSSREQVRNSKIIENISRTIIRTKLKPSEQSFLKKLLAKSGLDRSNLLSIYLAVRENFTSLSQQQYFRVKEHIEANRPDVIIYFWSTTLKQEKKTIDRILVEVGHRAKSILIVNTYPVRTNCEFRKRSFYSMFDKWYFESFDALSIPTEEMREHLLANRLIENKKVLVSPDEICPYLKRDNSKYINRAIEKELVFLGNTFFKSRSIDNVERQIQEIIDSGINVWVQNSKDIEANNSIKKFNSFGFEEILEGKLIDFVDRYSGVLMVYNGLNNARSHCSLPTRFAMALESKVPIFVQTGTFGSLVRSYPDKVFEYSDVDEIISVIESWDYNDSYVCNRESKELIWLSFIEEVLE